MRADGPHDISECTSARRHDERRVGGCVSRIFEDDETTAAGISFGQPRECRRDVVETIDEDVLEEVAGERLDGALVRALDDQVISERAPLADAARGIGQEQPRGVAERRAARLDLLERAQARFVAGERPLALAERARERLALGAAGGRL